jgi:hypothetical protein
MALLELIKQPGESKTIADDGTTSINIKYVAIFDAAPSSSFEADSLAGFFKGYALPGGSNLSLQTWTTTETDNELIWEFSNTYKTATFDDTGGGGPGGGGTDNSIGIEPFSWSETRETVVINTAGDPIFPAIQDNEYWPGIKVIWNDAVLDFENYNIGGAVNDTAITVAGIDIPAYCAKAGALEYRKVLNGTTTSWQKTLPIFLCFKKARGTGPAGQHTPGDTIGFRKEVINNGFRIKDTNGDPVPIVGLDGQELSQPVRINEDGDAVLEPDDNDFTILVEPAELNDFSDFDLPSAEPT